MYEAKLESTQIEQKSAKVAHYPHMALSEMQLFYPWIQVVINCPLYHAERILKISSKPVYEFLSWVARCKTLS